MGLGFSTTTCCKCVVGRAAESTRHLLTCWNLEASVTWLPHVGRAQWVRNPEAAGQVTLKKGRIRQDFRLRTLSESEKLPVLKAYLDTFKREVQQYFPVAAGAPAEDFRNVADAYPAFELTPLRRQAITDAPAFRGADKDLRAASFLQSPAILNAGS